MATNHLYDAVIIAVAFQGLLVVLLFVFLMVQRTLATLKAWHVKKREAVLLPLVERVLIEGPEATGDLEAAVRRNDKPILRSILIELTLSLRGEEAERAATLADEIGLVRTEARRLRSFRAQVRANAAKNLATWRVKSSLAALVEAAEKERDVGVRTPMVWAIGEVGGTDSVPYLLRSLEATDAGLVKRTSGVLARSGREAVGEIVEYVRRSQVATARRAALDALRLIGDLEANDLLLELADDPDPEIRIRTIKAAATIPDPRFQEVFEQRLRDPCWEVRCQAARGLGTLGNLRSAGHLREALGDSSWWVRFNAALALQRLGAEGRGALRDALDDQRPPARDIASHILSRYGELEVA